MAHRTPRRTFKVALTGDFYDAEGNPRYRDLGLSVFEGHPEIEQWAFTEHHAEIRTDQVKDFNGIIVLTPKVTPHSVSNSENLLAVGRFGVGYDSVDVEACTQADVLAYITAGAVDRSVAEATIAWMLALTHHVRVKDQLVRDGKWELRSRYMGSELRERTLGVIGMGGIGRSLIELLRGFGMRKPLVYDPFLDAQIASQMGVALVSLDELLRSADFVSVHCPLTEQTRNLIGREQLARMQPTAYLINTARGGIVDEDALYEALAEKRIAGAAIDCFATEPLTAPPRLAEFDNVILAPHCIAWTDELFRDIGQSACRGMLDLAHGNRPRGVVNPQVLDRPGFQEKWARLRAF